MSASNVLRTVVALLIGLAGGWMWCASRTPLKTEVQERVVYRETATPIALQILDCYEQPPPDVAAWANAAKGGNGLVLQPRRIDGKVPENVFAFFQTVPRGFLVIAGEWKTNSTLGLRYLEMAGGKFGVALDSAGTPRVKLWGNPGAADARPIRTKEVHPRFSDELRAIIFTGGALSDAQTSGELLKFFGAHVPLLGWKDNLPPELRRDMLAQPQTGFIGRLTLNRQEGVPAEPSITEEWLKAAAAGPKNEGAELATCVRAVSVTPRFRDPVLRGWTRRGADGPLEMTILNHFTSR